MENKDEGKEVVQVFMEELRLFVLSCTVDVLSDILLKSEGELQKECSVEMYAYVEKVLSKQVTAKYAGLRGA